MKLTHWQFQQSTKQGNCPLISGDYCGHCGWRGYRDYAIQLVIEIPEVVGGIEIRAFDNTLKQDPRDVAGYNDCEPSVYDTLEDDGEVERDEDYDPTPWCSYCRARTSKGCKCGPLADNE
jgi:hypothetical protein